MTIDTPEPEAHERDDSDPQQPPETPAGRHEQELPELGVGSVEERIQTLEQYAAQFVDGFDAVANELARMSGQDPDVLKRVPWRLNAVPEPMNLDAWVGYFNVVYRHYNEPKPIPSCWLHHPGFVAEIGTMYQTWRATFFLKGATADGAQNWHDRWLPGFTARTRQWLGRECLSSDGADCDAASAAREAAARATDAGETAP